MASIPLIYASRRTAQGFILPGHATRPRVVVEAGSSGSEVYAWNAMSSDAANNTLVVYHGKVMTLQSAMGTGALVDGGGGSDTITRTSGSFITDGWVVGDRFLVQGATTLANDFLATITAVTASTLTFATGTVSVAEDLPSGSKLYRISQAYTAAIPLDSGNSSIVASVNLLNTTLWAGLPASPKNIAPLGTNEVYALSAGTALGAGERMDFCAFVGDF